SRVDLVSLALCFERLGPPGPHRRAVAADRPWVVGADRPRVGDCGGPADPFLAVGPTSTRHRSPVSRARPAATEITRPGPPRGSPSPPVTPRRSLLRQQTVSSQPPAGPPVATRG